MKHQAIKTKIQTAKVVDPKIMPLKYNENGKSKQRKMKRKFAQITERLYDWTRNASSSSGLFPSAIGGGMSSTSGNCTPRYFHLNSVSGIAMLPAAWRPAAAGPPASP